MANKALCVWVGTVLELGLVKPHPPCTGNTCKSVIGSARKTPPAGMTCQFFPSGLQTRWTDGAAGASTGLVNLHRSFSSKCLAFGREASRTPLSFPSRTNARRVPGPWPVPGSADPGAGSCLSTRGSEEKIQKEKGYKERKWIGPKKSH